MKPLLRFAARPLAATLAALLLFGALRATADESPPPKSDAQKSDAPATGSIDDLKPTSVADLKKIESRVRDVARKITKAVVSVRVGASQGSGVIVSDDGFVLTAGHVVGKPDEEVVFTLPDGREVKGKTLGMNRAIDSGMMQITDKHPDGGKWPHVEMAEADQIEAGDWCVSAGHPGGYMEGRAPVIRLGRVLFTNERVLCSDCTLVGGDSGGPLFDLEGRVVGIHSRIGWQVTTNFHVPINTYHDTWDRLAAGEAWGGRGGGGTPAEGRPLIGVGVQRRSSVCKINQVFPRSPAARAGIRVGDVIRKFDGSDVGGFADLVAQLSEKEPGDEVDLLLDRDGEEVTIKLKLGGIARPLPGGPEEPDDGERDE